jgi:4-hydroxythreonine-4-phosphate dehydrogenase
MPGPRISSAALDALPPVEIVHGSVNAALGRVAMESIRAAVAACAQGTAAALVTAPLTKAGIHAAGYHEAGQTDFLAALTQTPRHAMMLSCDCMRVVLVTHHQALRSVADAISHDAIFEKILLCHETGRRLRLPHIRIAVAALNPHASEAGAFGDEEQRVIAPAIAAARAQGIDATGPHVPDAVFRSAVHGDYDFVVAMYHDQGLIPLKLLGFESSVNTTLGLPVVRTAPGHGSAYDIAGRNCANPAPMIAAIRMAADLAGVDAGQ